MKRLIGAVLLVLAGYSLVSPRTTYGQSASIAGLPGAQLEPNENPPYIQESGIRSPQFRFDYSPGLARLSSATDSSAHGSRTTHIFSGLLIGAATGLAAGLLLDHTADNQGNRCTDNCDHIRWSFEILTAPLGLIVGGIVGALLPVH